MATRTGTGDGDAPQSHRQVDQPAGQSVRRLRRIPIAILLGLSLGALVLLAASSVLVISIWSGVQSTIDLLREQAVFAIHTVEESLEDHLSPAEYQLDFINDLIVSGRLDPTDDQRMEDVLTGALAATPQVDGIVFIDITRRMRGVMRTGGGGFWIDEDRSGDPSYETLDAWGADNKSGSWGDIVWSPDLDVAVQTITRPVMVNGNVIGVLGAGVSILKLSRFVERFESDFGTHVFILRGYHQVLAHADVMDGIEGLSPTKPLPLLEEIDDPVLAKIWDPDAIEFTTLSDSGVVSHGVEYGGEEWFFVYRWIEHYGPEPWLIGSYFRASDLEEEFDRLENAMFAGLIVLVLGIIAAFFIGRRIAGPVHSLAISAQRIGALEFDKVEPLKRSRMRELDEAAGAFNLMLGGLRWFENYVPRKLVRQLMGDNDSVLVSEERVVTVMFTDIAGFTTLSEGLPPGETAAFLNRHFERITTCVEAQGGTVDKYIGDGVMAFWGAPEDQPDHAIRACRAALAIVAVIADHNADRKRRGDPVVRMRIGLHTGAVVVGNIGAPDRVNYTIVGDTVNTCQRIESMGKTLEAGELDVAVHISATTRQELDGSFTTVSVGVHEIKGRNAEVEIFRLEG